MQIIIFFFFFNSLLLAPLIGLKLCSVEALRDLGKSIVLALVLLS